MADNDSTLISLRHIGGALEGTLANLRTGLGLIYDELQNTSAADAEVRLQAQGRLFFLSESIELHIEKVKTVSDQVYDLEESLQQGETLKIVSG